MASSSWAAFGGAHSCAGVNRALGCLWPQEGQPSHSCKPRDNPHPAQAAASFSVCCDQMGSVGWWRAQETPAQLPPGSLPGRDCPADVPGCICILRDPAVPGRHVWCWGRAEGAELQAHRLLLFGGNLFCPHPRSLHAPAMARDKEPSHYCITQRREKPAPANLVWCQGKIKLFLLF